MYERYFQLRERPFALSPDPEYLYPSRVHQEAMSYLRYGIEGHAGFVVITGEIGSGKTTLLQSVLRRLDSNTTVARIVNTMLDPHELLETILLDFGVDPAGMSKPAMLKALGTFLVQQRQSGRLTILAIDEAQNLSLAALEEIRLLSNLETEKSKLIQIVMIGQPQLRQKLALPQLEQLRQRITVSYHLKPLDSDETANYINHRLKRAAIAAPLVFPRDVTDAIHERSRGVPRIVNVIADATLLFAYGVDCRDVNLAVTTEAISELDATGVLASYDAEAVESAESAVSVDESDATPIVADDVSRREQMVRQWERQVRQREQALAAQQRVIAEEARLLEASRRIGSAPAAAATMAAPIATASASIPTAAPATSARVPAGAVSTASTRQSSFAQPLTDRPIRVQAYQAAVHAGPPTVWDRLRRVLFGAEV